MDRIRIRSPPPLSDDLAVHSGWGQQILTKKSQGPNQTHKAKKHTNSTKQFSEQLEGMTPVKQGCWDKSNQNILFSLAGKGDVLQTAAGAAFGPTRFSFVRWKTKETAGRGRPTNGHDIFRQMSRQFCDKKRQKATLPETLFMRHK